MHLGSRAGRWRWYSPKSKGHVNTEVENANIAEYEIFFLALFNKLNISLPKKLWQHSFIKM